MVKKTGIFLFILLVLNACSGDLNPELMSGWRANGLNGPVKEITQDDGVKFSFNKDGNILAGQDYVNATRYIYYNEPYVILFEGNQRIEAWDSPEFLNTTYIFDKKGRLKELHKSNYGENLSQVFYYKGNNTLPVKMEESIGWEGGMVETTYTYTYSSTDNHGNWTHMKAEIETKDTQYPDYEGDPVVNIENTTVEIKRSLSYYSSDELAIAEVYTAKDIPSRGPRYEQYGGSSSTKVPLKDRIGTILEGILVFGLLLLMIGHMIYIKFIAGARYPTVFTPDYFRDARMARGENEEASEDETHQARELLEQAFDCWPVCQRSGEDEEEFRKPTKMKQIKKSAGFIDQVIQIAPTDQETIDFLNEFTEVVNFNEERHFDGSRKLIVISTIFAIACYFMVGWDMALTMGGGVLVYVLASMTPNFLIEKRAARGGGNIHNGIFAGVLAMIAGARTIRTTTTWSDGSKTSEDDNSQHFLALAFGFIVLFMLAAMIAFWAILNYVRNYLLYF